MSSSVVITSVHFTGYKALFDYSCKLEHINILIGPNNCGKSTIISAFRILEIALRSAKNKRPIPFKGPTGFVNGYILAKESLPTSIENIHTDLADIDTTVTFRLSNGNSLILYFPKEEGVYLIPKTKGIKVKSASDFRAEYPISIRTIPILGPVEHEEASVLEETVKKDYITQRASRHFRNYWHYFPENFMEFAELIKTTWPGMEIEPPVMSEDYKTVYMFCRESRHPRELYWAGFGFQVWCQLLTHISRCREDTLLIVDEPEIYLHPDLQRQLLGILRDAGPDILLATHSAEIISEADACEILSINKQKKAAYRFKNIEDKQRGLIDIGSYHNIILTQLARNHKLLFVEGNDFRIIRRFAQRIGLHELSTGNDFTIIRSEGFDSWGKIKSFAEIFQKDLQCDIEIGIIRDRDYRSDEEIDDIKAELEKHLNFVYIFEWKELENYLLVPDVLQSALEESINERRIRTGQSIDHVISAKDILEQITNPMKSYVHGQYISKREAYLRHSGKDPATITTETIQYLESIWQNIYTRIKIIPGKETLHNLRTMIQEKYHTNLTDNQIIRHFNANNIPYDLVRMLQKLDGFRRLNVNFA